MFDSGKRWRKTAFVKISFCGGTWKSWHASEERTTTTNSNSTSRSSLPTWNESRLIANNRTDCITYEKYLGLVNTIVQSQNRFQIKALADIRNEAVQQTGLETGSRSGGFNDPSFEAQSWKLSLYGPRKVRQLHYSCQPTHSALSAKLLCYPRIFPKSSRSLLHFDQQLERGSTHEVTLFRLLCNTVFASKSKFPHRIPFGQFKFPNNDNMTLSVWAFSTDSSLPPATRY